MDPKPCVVCGKSTVCRSENTNAPRCYGCDGIPPEGEFKEEGLRCHQCFSGNKPLVYDATFHGLSLAFVCTKCLCVDEK
jgi:hypothetical protein